MPQAIPVAAGLLGGPVGNIVGGIVGNIVPNLLGGGGKCGSSGPGGLLGSALGGIKDAFQNLFCRKQHRPHHHCCSHRPPCFSNNTTNNYNIDINIQNNPFGALKNFGQMFQGIAKQIGETLQNVLGGLGLGGANGAPQCGGSGGSSGGAGSSGGVGSSGGSGSSGGGVSVGNLDATMNKARELLNSDSMQDQLKGQELMQKAMRLFEMMSKLIESQNQMQSKAIAAIR